MSRCPKCAGKGFIVVTLADGDVERDLCPVCEPTICQGCGEEYARNEMADEDGQGVEFWCADCWRDLNDAAAALADEDHATYNRIVAEGMNR